MLATLIAAPFDGAEWVFETKWGGFRLVARIEKGSVTLYSRSGLIVSDDYEAIAKALEKVKRDAVIDGEPVALGRARHLALPAAPKCPQHVRQSPILRLRHHVSRRQ